MPLEGMKKGGPRDCPIAISASRASEGLFWESEFVFRVSVFRGYERPQGLGRALLVSAFRAVEFLSRVSAILGLESERLCECPSIIQEFEFGDPEWRFESRLLLRSRPGKRHSSKPSQEGRNRARARAKQVL